ncbi:PTS sugar transporter subunit IIA [bacterium]|nr:PTS sugar transporter subunit IIA [bacterium]
MIGILLVTHGTLAKGLKDAVELIIGEQEKLSTIGLFKDDSVDALPKRIESAITELGEIYGVLVLADLFGASPFNASARFTHSFESLPSDVVTGVNLGMLLEVLMQRDSKSITELSELAVKSGQEGIISLAQKVAEK